MAAWGNKKYYQIQSVKGKFITSLGPVSKLCLHYLIVPVSIFNSINEVYETEVSQLITDKARQWSGVGPIKKWSECWVEFKQLSQHVGRSLSHSHKAQFSGHCGLLILGDKFRPLHLHNRTHQQCICQNNKKTAILTNKCKSFFLRTMTFVQSHSQFRSVIAKSWLVCFCHFYFFAYCYFHFLRNWPNVHFPWNIF